MPLAQELTTLARQARPAVIIAAQTLPEKSASTAAMSQTLVADPRLQRILALGMQYPESSQLVAHNHATLRVRGKVFAYFLANHDNDGITSLCVRAAAGENTDRVGREPGRFYLPPYIGKRGWFGLRLDRGRIDWNEVANLLELSYCLAAPKKLAALVHAGLAPDAPKAAAKKSPAKRKRS